MGKSNDKPKSLSDFILDEEGQRIFRILEGELGSAVAKETLERANHYARILKKDSTYVVTYLRRIHENYRGNNK